MALKTTPTSPAAWRPDRTEYVPSDVIPDAVMLQASLVVGQIEGDAPAVRVPWVSNDGTPGFVLEGTKIPEADQALSEVVVTTRKVAQIGKYSRETLAQPEAARLIVESLSRGIATSANAAFLRNGVNTDGPTGLLGTAGIIDGGKVAANLDPVVDAVAAIESDGGTATHVIAGPDSWAVLSKLKRDTTSNESLIGAGVVQPQRLLMGLPVLVSRSMPANGVLVLDRAATVSAQSPIYMKRSDDFYLDYDSIAILISWRIGWSVQRPKRLVKLSTAK